MGMKNLKGGEVCSTAGVRVTAAGIYTFTVSEAKQTTDNFNLFMNLLCNSFRDSSILENMHVAISKKLA